MKVFNLLPDTSSRTWLDSKEGLVGLLLRLSTSCLNCFFILDVERELRGSVKMQIKTLLNKIYSNEIQEDYSYQKLERSFVPGQLPNVGRLRGVL